MSYNKQGFATRLNALCEDAGIADNQRQNELIALTKKQQPSVWAWLRGKSVPGPDNLLKILRWGKTTADWLLFETGPKHPNQTATAVYARDGLEEQLLEMYRSLDKEEDKDWLLAQANYAYNKAHPGKGIGEPFAPDEPPEPPPKPPQPPKKPPVAKKREKTKGTL